MIRSRSSAPEVLVPLLVLLIVMLAPLVSAQELQHGIPAYDSGWRTFVGGDVMIFYHGISGDIDDYVIDLQFKDTDHPWPASAYISATTAVTIAAAPGGRS